MSAIFYIFVSYILSIIHINNVVWIFLVVLRLAFEVRSTLSLQKSCKNQVRKAPNQGDLVASRIIASD